MSDENLKPLYEYIENNKRKYIDGLRTWVEIPSVSAETEHREDVFKMMEVCKQELEAIGVNAKLVDNPLNANKSEGDVKLPPIILGVLGEDCNKKTLCVYGHLDVQPAKVEDGWDYEPFKLTETDDGKLYGRGSTDDKGPVLGWINVLSAYQALNMEIPVNIRFCFEGMEESGSEGFDELIAENPSFFSNVDFVCISDNYWLGKEKPCITYGLRGISYYHVVMKCADKDLHSGVFGGTVHEAMTDLVHLLSKLVDHNGKITIPGVNELVDELTEDEDKLYEPIEFDPEEYRQDIGCKDLLHKGEDRKKKTLQHRWRYPSLSIHGFEGAFDGAGAKTVIPRQVTGKFSIRLVPSQTPEKVNELVRSYLRELHEKSGSANEILEIKAEHGGLPWLSNYSDKNYTAGINAVKRVFGKEPDLTREGGSIPVTLSLQNATKTSVMLLPIGASDDGAHSQNEKINVYNYINGIKVLGTYIDELGRSQKK